MPGMGLGVEEYFGVYYLVRMGTGQVGMRHVVEVLLGAQHHGAGVVDVQETLQVVEHIGPAQRLHVRIGKRHAITLAQRKNQLGFERAFDMHMQFGFWHVAQQVRQTLGGHGFDFHFCFP